MKRFIRRAVYWVPAVVWMGVIFYFSSLSKPVPGVEDTSYETQLNRLFHLAEYAFLTFWFYFGWVKGRVFQSNVGHKQVFYSALMSFVYALVDEAHQVFVPGRMFEVVDLFLDAGGAGFAVLCLWLLNRKD